MQNVLVIDDEKMISDMLQIALTQFVYSVETAPGGKEGLQKYEDGDFNLVITDIRMPDTDGNDVVRHIRNSDKPHTPVIGMSGTPWLLDGDGFDCTLSKPFGIKTLISTVNELTSNHKNSDQKIIPSNNPL